jgi:GPI mannosyltransferase 2
MVTITEVSDDEKPVVRPTRIRNTLREPIKNPILQLTFIFALWRTFLFAIALFTPSPPYDTSASRILTPIHPEDSAIVSGLKYFCEKLTRWDGIYYLKVAERGYVNEQEWAFGWGYTLVMGNLGQGTAPTLPGYLSTHS